MRSETTQPSASPPSSKAARGEVAGSNQGPLLAPAPSHVGTRPRRLPCWGATADPPLLLLPAAFNGEACSALALPCQRPPGLTGFFRPQEPQNPASASEGRERPLHAPGSRGGGVSKRRQTPQSGGCQGGGGRKRTQGSFVTSGMDRFAAAFLFLFFFPLARRSRTPKILGDRRNRRWERLSSRRLSVQLKKGRMRPPGSAPEMRRREG